MIASPRPTSSPHDLPLQIDPAELRRRLGYRRGGEPAPRVADRIEALSREARELARPRGLFRILPPAEAAAIGVPGTAVEVGLGLCTLGTELEVEARRRGEAERTLDALVFDAWGSAAVEAAADALESEICAQARELGLFPAHRVSPGYGRWAIESQPTLLARLDAAALGVRLTPGGMMDPQKSISFAVRCRATPPRPATGRRRCACCGLLDCAYRAEEVS